MNDCYKDALSIVNLYHLWGIKIIIFLQTYLKVFIPFFEFITVVTQPFVSIYYIFPIVFFILPQMGLAVIWAAVIAEVINILLKILINGERPYWWASEHSTKSCCLKLTQYYNTCSTSPGTPSGHMLITTATLLTVAMLWCTKSKKVSNVNDFKLFILFILFSTFISRIILAVNFPHQVIIGCIIGFLVAIFVFEYDLYKCAPVTYLKVSLLLLLVAMGVKYILPKFGYCTLWSFMKAKRYCSNPDSVPKCYTKGSVSLIKLASIIAGTGIAMMIVSSTNNCKVRIKNCSFTRNIAIIISVCLTTIIYLQSGQYFGKVLPGYSFMILKNILLPIIVMVIIPFSLGLYDT